MAVMAWFKKERKPRASQRNRLEIPADAWEKCDGCGHVDIKEKFEKALNVCPECGRHRRFTAEEYIELLTDAGTWRELYGNLRSVDPLKFEHYSERLTSARKKAGHADAMYAGTAKLEEKQSRLIQAVRERAAAAEDLAGLEGTLCAGPCEDLRTIDPKELRARLEAAYAAFMEYWLSFSDRWAPR